MSDVATYTVDVRCLNCGHEEQGAEIRKGYAVGADRVCPNCGVQALIRDTRVTK